MDKEWTNEAWDGYVSLQSDEVLLEKTNEIISDIDRNGYAGLGKPEPLKADLSGYWSRRIDDYNRIVYKIEGDAIYIAQCGSHYHK